MLQITQNSIKKFLSIFHILGFKFLYRKACGTNIFKAQITDHLTV